MFPSSSRSSWLCRDEADRERVVDMERRLRPVRTIAFAILAGALLVSGHWIGWWTLVPLAVAIVGFALADRTMATAERPELVIAGAWVLSQVVIAASIAILGGPGSPAVSWLAIPVVTLGARFTSRGVAAGLVLTVLLMVAVTIGMDGSNVASHPQTLIFPLALLGAIAILSTALMRSDLEHRSDSVLDRLTGMLNRRSLDSRVVELEQQSRLTSEPVGLVLCDLDSFKAINDAHGHGTGDAVLVDVAYTLRKELRAFDLAYRLGGEEFLVLLPGADAESAAEVAERLRLAVELTRSGGLSVTLSCGAASSGRLPFHYESLFAQADAALYRAKAGGRNRVGIAGAAEAERTLA
jgi:diguanylate cyclase (GGDEF)-like protein